MARFIRRASLETLQKSSPYEIRKFVDSAEWIKGKPPAQPATYWKENETAVISIPEPKRWQKAGRYILYRHDGGKRLRRGRAAVAVYDRKKKRHAWALVTPLHSHTRAIVAPRDNTKSTEGASSIYRSIRWTLDYGD